MSQKLDVPKAGCPIKLDVRKAGCPVAECPKAECPKAECLSVLFKQNLFWNDISNAAIACEVAVELSDLFAILTQSIRKFNSTNIVIPFLQEEFYLIPRFGSILDSVHIYIMLSYICYFEHLSVTCFNECRPSVSAYLLRQKMPAPWITNQPECY